MRSKIVLFLVSLAFFKVSCKAKWSADMKTFSHAIKGAYCKANLETEVFHYKNGPGVVTEQWFTGGECFGPNTIIRYYIDDDFTPYIEMNLYMGHGIGFVTPPTNIGNKTQPELVTGDTIVVGEDMGIPWGTRRIGHTANGGGIYNTIRMPFKKSIRVTFETPSQGYYWFIIRGAENYPIVIGDLELPKTAMLKLYKKENYVLQPSEYAQLVSTSNKSGLLYQVSLAASSIDFHYLEACFRVLIDDESSFQYLSSGTEDFFLSAFYYSAGIYHTDHAGLTYLKKPGTMSAYKFFEEDPVAFSKSLKLIWRCGEVFSDSGCFKPSNNNVCLLKDANGYCKNPANNANDLSPHVTKMTSYVWTYEW